MTPNPRPIPRFIADSTQEGIPHGRFAERLAACFKEACEEIADLPKGVQVPAEPEWFLARAWGGRVCVPCTARAEVAHEDPARAAGDCRELSGPTHAPSCRGVRLAGLSAPGR